MVEGVAPAKVNLALHVTGRRADGYHLLDSLVVFPAVGDRLAAAPASALTLQVDGPFAAGVPTDGGNLVLRAAAALAAARGVTAGAALRLTKVLPHAAGIGGGSSDAAAAIGILAELWGVEPLAPGDPAVAALGADVPVCMTAPLPRRMSGIGEVLAPVAGLPPCALVLVNPGVAVPTRDVFAAMTDKDNAPMTPLPPPGTGFAGFADWLAAQRNDMAPAAVTLAPGIGMALDRLKATPGVHLARMSGSGATCFGLCRDLPGAQAAARAIAAAHPGWWVVAATVGP